MIPVGFRIAVRHLTVWPLAWDARENDIAQASALPWFPLIGLAIGVLVAAVLLLPIPPLAAAALALAAWIVASGGLHEDALMDCADAVVPPVERTRRVEILKDPHVGAHGVTAAGLFTLARFAGLVGAPITAALVAPIAGRWCMALTVALGPPLHDGMGARFAEGAARFLPTLITLPILAALGIVIDWRIAAAAIPGTLMGVGSGYAIAHRLGGFNGDVHGAAGVIAETCTLYVCLVGVNP